MMKRICSFALAALTFLALSCQKEQTETPSASGRMIEKTFQVNAASTKTSLDGMRMLWSEGDQINVIAAGSGNQYAFDLVQGAQTTSATFHGSIAEEDAEETTFYAIYPNVAIDAAKLSAGTIEVSKSLGATQTAVPDGFDPHFAVMTAVSDESGTFSFRHGVAYFKLTIGNEHVKSVRLETGNTRFQGRPVYNLDGSYNQINSAQNFINLTASGEELPLGTTYYIPVLCKSSNLGTLSVTYSFNDGTPDASISTDKKAKVKLELGKIYDLGTPVISLSPVVQAENLSLEADVTSASLPYELLFPQADGVLSAELIEEVDWLTIGTISDDAVALQLEPNKAGIRSAHILLRYRYQGGSQEASREVTVTQKASAAVESHRHVFYIDSKKAKQNLSDDAASDYFDAGQSSTADLGGDYAISSWELGDYTSTKGLKMNSSGVLSFTTSEQLNSTLRFYFIRRKTGDTTAQMQLIPEGGTAQYFDTAYDRISDSGTIELEKGTTYTLKQKSKEQALLLVIVDETE